jgi:lipoate-protein ligase A
MSDESTLRVIDFGRVSGLRSQTLWHAIAHGVSSGAPPTLSFMQPGDPYVSIGYHRSINELNPENELPVYRRMVGGGPVYVDDGQYFFQIVVPLAMAPARRDDAIRTLLEPAVEAFNDVGIAATLDARNEVVLGDRKICGHAAGQISGSVVVVGNLITRFDHGAAASIVRAPSEVAREEFLSQMKRYVLATPADPGLFLQAAGPRYGEKLGLGAEPGTLADEEQAQLNIFDTLFVDPEWVDASPARGNGMWRAKVKSGVWVGSAASNGHRVTASFHDGEIKKVRVEGPDETFEEMDQLLAALASNPPI